jgi:hypothetical protein
MNEWTAAAPVILETAQRPRRRMRRWQKWIIVTMIWSGLAVLLIQAATRNSDAPGALYSILALAAIIVTHSVVAAIAWRYGRLS